eukprot:scaffold321003_cov15-Prasinocladus_malaysianus.AAC.1
MARSYQLLDVVMHYNCYRWFFLPAYIAVIAAAAAAAYVKDQMEAGPSFRVPEVPARDKLARKLASNTPAAVKHRRKGYNTKNATERRSRGEMLGLEKYKGYQSCINYK